MRFLRCLLIAGVLAPTFHMLLPLFTPMLYAQLGSTAKPSASGISYTAPGSNTKRTQADKNAERVSVKDYGAKGDWNGSTGTNDYAAIAAAIGNTPRGGTLYFPCGSGSFRIKQPLSFSGKQDITIRGDDAVNCKIIYDGAGPQTAAFNFVGAYMLTLQDIKLATTSNNPAKTVVLFGRTAANAAGGNHSFRHAHVDGYATTALIYNVAAEENVFTDVDFTLRGGGAKYVSYSSQADDLSVASLPTSTLTSFWMSDFKVRNYSSTIPDDAALFYIVTGPDTGNYHYNNGYGSAAGGSGFRLSCLSTFGNENPISAESVRFENLINATVYLEGPRAGVDPPLARYAIKFRHIESSSSPKYFFYGEDNSGLLNAAIYDNNPTNRPSSFYHVLSSRIDEGYDADITIRGKATNSVLVHRSLRNRYVIGSNVNSWVWETGQLQNVTIPKATITTATLPTANITTANIATLNVTNLPKVPITGSTQCLHVDANGVISGTGTDCGPITITLAQTAGTEATTTATTGWQNTTWTAPSNGYYRFTLSASVTAVGRAGTVQANVACNDGAAQAGAATALTLLKAGTSGTIICKMWTRDTFQYDVIFAGATGSPVVTYNTFVERVR